MQSPFVVGKMYRVRRDFTALRDIFHAGEVLRYESDAYSSYHGVTGYFFSQVPGDRPRSWDIYDDENVNIWQELFEPIEAIRAI